MLFPTLIAACHEHLGNATAAGDELSMELLAEFLEGNLAAWRADEPPAIGGGVDAASTVGSGSANFDIDAYYPECG